MPTSAILRVLPDGAPTTVYAGGILGRGASSALPIPTAAVHEAHAVVSYREGRLVVLAARGGLWEGGKERKRIELRAGRAFALDPEGHVRIEVVGLQVYGSTLVVALDPHREAALQPGRTYRIHPDDPDGWIRTEGAAGVALLWTAETSWYLEPTGKPAVRLEAGQRHVLPGGAVLSVGVVPVDDAQTILLVDSEEPEELGHTFVLKYVGEQTVVEAGGAKLLGDAAVLLSVLLLALVGGEGSLDKQDAWGRAKGKAAWHSGRFSKLCGEINEWLKRLGPGRAVDASRPSLVTLSLDPRDQVGDQTTEAGRRLGPRRVPGGG